MILRPRRALIVAADASITSVVRRMIESKISSALVRSSDDKIVGIMTERDVIRKLALLPVDISLGHSISTVMTRPVKFVSSMNLLEDVKRLHKEERVRHFPVLHDPKAVPDVKNVAGILTVTDIARAYFETLPSL